MNADTFNALYEVGTPVFAYPGARPEDDANAERVVTRTRTKAELFRGCRDVVWVEDLGAYVLLSHVDVVPEGEWKAAQTAAAVAEMGALPMPAGVQPGVRTLDVVEEELTGANLSLWEEEQDNARLRMALASAQRGRRELRARVAELDAVRAERDALQKRLHEAAMTRTWRNEDGKKFVFVEDIAPALLGIERKSEAAS